MEEMAELIKVSVSKRGSVKLDLGRNLPLVLGNRAQIRQIVVNLVINASEAIAERGIITIATSRATDRRDVTPNSPTEPSDNAYVRLSISDTGRGLTEDERQDF